MEKDQETGTGPFDKAIIHISFHLITLGEIFFDFLSILFKETWQK